MNPTTLDDMTASRGYEATGAIIQSAADQRPSVGRMVRVVQGKKHKGEEGVVFWHGRDFAPRSRYGGPHVQAFGDAIGRWGFRVGVDFSGERVFMSAANVEVI